MASNDILIEAAKKGDIDGVLRCLQRGDDVDETDDGGRTGLCWAIRNEHTDVALMLLEMGAGPSPRSNRIHYVPLIHAAKKGLTQVVSSLIEKGASVNDIDMEGDTALGYAASYGHQDIVVELIGNGAWINASNNDEWTALHWASSENQLEVVGILLKNGADSNRVNMDGKTALVIAKEQNHEEMVQLLETSEEGQMRELMEVTATLRERVERMEEKRQWNQVRIVNLIERMIRVEEELKRKERQIETLIERDNRLEDEIRMKDGQIVALTEWVIGQWSEEKRLMNERIDQLEKDKQLKDGRKEEFLKVTELEKLKMEMITNDEESAPTETVS